MRPDTWGETQRRDSTILGIVGVTGDRGEGGGQHDRVEGAWGYCLDGGNGAWDTRGATAEGPWSDRGRAGAGHAQDDFIYQGDSLRDCQAYNKHVRKRMRRNGNGDTAKQSESAIGGGRFTRLVVMKKKKGCGRDGAVSIRPSMTSVIQRGWLSRWTAYDPGFLIQAEGWGHAVSR